MDNFFGSGYLGNENIKRKGIPVSWTKEMILEWKKCADDPIYFAEKYIQIVHVDHGLIPINMYDYQKEITTKITNNRRCAVVTSRQAGKCLYRESFINIRNKTTGEIKKISVEDFYNLSKPNNEVNSSK